MSLHIIISHMRLLLICGVTLLSAMLSACSSGGGETKTVIAPRDTAAYNRGMEDARRMLDDVRDEASLHDALLEVRSRETYIHDKIRPEAAEAYVEGFKDFIRAHNDSLARVLF